MGILGEWGKVSALMRLSFQQGCGMDRIQTSERRESCEMVVSGSEQGGET